MSWPENSLDSLLGAAGVDLSPERMQWMVITWDLSQVTRINNDFFRVFLTVDTSLTVHGDITPSVFDARTPRIGTTGDYTGATGGSLEKALIYTDDALEDGYEMLCRPLAVDFSEFAGGPETGQPYEMLFAMSVGSAEGRRVLGRINAARQKAFATHASPEAHRNRFRDADKLWLGR